MRVEQNLKSKKQMEKVKIELKSLLDEHVPGLEVEDKVVRPSAGGLFSLERSAGSKKQQVSGRGGSSSQDLSHLRRRGGMVVFAK